MKNLFLILVTERIFDVLWNGLEMLCDAKHLILEEQYQSDASINDRNIVGVEYLLRRDAVVHVVVVADK
ncbi:Hypothetical predicted protein [Octopus vulgaris]|uniref:Uncharacterized protein n=1 Tax=Octopus vulgaris TaxID=6645 RepID=A0AA36BJI7_OCTVU|nr:Hypothetical predicted protein [Octopus vulgaris]